MQRPAKPCTPVRFRLQPGRGDQNDINLIEDAAQSFGAIATHDQKSCSIADISTTSFFPSKPLGCYKQSKKIFSDDQDL